MNLMNKNEENLLRINRKKYKNLIFFLVKKEKKTKKFIFFLSH